MSIYSDLIRDVKKKEPSLSKMEEFFGLFLEKNFHLSTCHFLMSYYGSLMFRMEKEFSSDSLPFFEKFKHFVEEVSHKEEISETDRAEIENLRVSLRLTTEKLIAYQTAFSHFIYALDRKLCPYDCKLPQDRDDYARELLGFLFESRDSFVTNMRISEIRKYLPIRYTKEKFLDLVSDSLGLYLGNDKMALNSQLYKIRMATMANLKEDEEELKSFAVLFLKLKALDIKNLDTEEIENIREEIDEMMARLSLYLEENQVLMEVVNSLYSMLLVEDNDLWSFITEEKACIQKISFAHREMKDFKEEEFSDILDSFVYKIEDLNEEILQGETAFEYLLEHFFDELDEAGLAKERNNLTELLLLRENPFLNKDELTQSGEVSEKELEAMKEGLREELTEVLSAYALPVRRAIMAEILSTLPLSFENRTEVMDYIRTALSTCDNQEELKACIHAIDEIRRDDGNYL